MEPVKPKPAKTEPQKTGPQKMEPVKTAIVGLGRIASLLEDDRLREKPCTHAGAVAANPGLELAAGSDYDEERRELFARRWKVPVYADAASMLAREKPGILIIATHPDSHESYCRLAAEAGVPVAVSEKPLAAKLSSARRIAELHRAGKIKILVNHERRYSADYQKARAMLNGLGRILSVRALLCMGLRRRLIDVLWHDGTHLADAAMFLSGAELRLQKIWGGALRAREGTAFLLGSLRPPKGNLARLSGQDAARSSGQNTARLSEKGVPFLMEIGAERDHLVFELEFSCERGRLRIGNRVFEVWESGPSPYAEGFNSLKKTDDAFAGPTGYFANMIADALACYRDREREPLSSALDGYRAIMFLHSAGRWT
ncbi:MAG: Gfo/Idh/MocA family oxidoreductase [Spirochaetaceae bacterium]|jgi:predicted dehydrogenase|nr:Gfo/Idh/MocA family oxidoreductase [Spirochaetaceae bacterium]